VRHKRVACVGSWFSEPESVIKLGKLVDIWVVDASQPIVLAIIELLAKVRVEGSIPFARSNFSMT
jgi:hypothetical protein